MKISFNKIREYLYIVWIFFLIYFPPFCPVNTIFIVGGMAWLYIIWNHKFLNSVYDVRRLALLFLVLVCLCFYIVYVGFLNSWTILNAAGGMIYFTIFTFPAALALGMEAYKLKFDKLKVFKLVIAAAVIQGILAILTYLFYDFQSIFVKLFYHTMVRSVVDYWREKRLYGISNTMTFSMPIAQGVIGILTLIYALKRNSKYIVLVPVIWIAGILNARASLVVIILGMVCTVLSFKMTNTKTLKIILGIMAGAAAFAAIVFRMVTMVGNGDSAQWILNGVNEVMAFIRGEKVGYFSYLNISDNAKVFQTPSGLGILFGAGKMGIQSDIGYIHDLWVGGIFYCLAVYALWTWLIYGIYKTLKAYDKRIARGISLFLLLTLAAVNVKGHIFGLNEFMNLLLLAVVLLVYQKPDRRIRGGKYGK